MSNRVTVNVSLPSDEAHYWEAQVASGRFQSTDQLVYEALQLLKEHEIDLEATREELRDKINLGLEQAQRGEVYTPEEVRTALDEHRKRRTASK